jgi:hypothetical protein
MPAPLRPPPRPLHRELAVIWRDIAALRPDPQNPRIHSKQQLKRLARSIAAFGFNVPLLVDAELRVLAGHGRLAAARSLGFTRVPTIALDHLNEAEARAFMIADNRLAELSAWDDRRLASQLGDLSALDLDVAIAATGFAPNEISLMTREQPGAVPPTAGSTVRRRQAMRKTQHAVSRHGQSWRLGPHRVLCAASLDAGAWRMLLGAAPAVVVIADPARADRVVQRWQEETGAAAYDMATGRRFGPGDGAHRDG